MARPAGGVQRVTVACPAALVADGALGARCLSTGQQTDSSRALRLFLPATGAGPSGRPRRLAAEPRHQQFRGRVPCVPHVRRLHWFGEVAVWVAFAVFGLSILLSAQVLGALTALAIMLAGWFLPYLDPVRIEVRANREQAVLRGVHPEAVPGLEACGAWVTD